MKIALIGCGKFGKNYLRILNDLQVHCQVVDPQHTGAVSYEYAAKWCDAAIVATPASTHADITCDLLERGKHVLVEKPMATSLRDATRMDQLALSQEKVLMVSDPFSYFSFPHYTDGLVRYAHAAWVNHGREREDVSVFWDMAPHAIGIFSRMFGDPARASCFGETLCLSYDGMNADVFVSWSGPRVRDIMIVTTGFPCAWTWHVDTMAPEKEPLLSQVEDFLSRISGGKIMSCSSGIQVVRILEMAGC